MSREGDFSSKTKHQAIKRQNGVCAFCGVSLKTPWTEGDFQGNAHHLQPLLHGGDARLDNCVYLCWGHHLFLGHGMSPYGIDEQGGSSDTWVLLDRDEFEFWYSEDL